MGIVFNKRLTNDYEETIEETVKEFYINKHLKDFLTTDINDAWIDLSVQSSWASQPKNLVYPRNNKRVTYYYELDCLKNFFNRDFQIMSIPDMIRLIRTTGNPNYFVKCIYPKKFHFLITPYTLEESMDYLYSYAMQYESDKVLMVQDLIPMEHEIRFLVFDGRIISCSAQVDEYTPLVNAFKKRWFTKTARIRGNKNTLNTPISKNDFYKMVGKCARIVLELALEGILDYSLDMCISNGQPTLVEINPLSNSGLFGNDYERLVLAVKNFYLNI